MILRQHYCIILAASLGKIFSCILGRVATIRLIIFNINPTLQKKNCNDVLFLFCFSAG